MTTFFTEGLIQLMQQLFLTTSQVDRSFNRQHDTSGHLQNHHAQG